MKDCYYTITGKVSHWLLFLQPTVSTITFLHSLTHIYISLQILLLPPWADRHLVSSPAKNSRHPKWRLFISLHQVGWKEREGLKIGMTFSSVSIAIQGLSLSSHVKPFLCTHIPALSSNHWGHWNLAYYFPFGLFCTTSVSLWRTLQYANLLCWCSIQQTLSNLRSKEKN